MTPRPIFERIKDLVVACYDPDEVALFGSHAKGRAHRTSDVDILVIADFREPPARRGDDVRQLLRRYPIRADVHCASREEVTAAARIPHGFLGSILSSRVVLYRRQESIDGVLQPW